ncbi:MAG: signal peptide peptidase SppA [Proteobacteria bacterium]|nr:signal peptide peptidase SppA [Pseudomonadota bacterium]
MFSRRHPFLFFILVFTGIVAGSSIVLSLIVSENIGSVEKQSGEKVGVIEINGAIIESKTILDNLKSFREDDSIKAIVVRIDSPGGGVGPSQEIFRAIEKVRAKKHVIASMGALAASGGYYAASATEGIMANPGTITGSIGVIMGYTNFKDIFDKIGLVPVVIKSGAFKDTGSPVREMREDEKVFLQDFVNKIHEQFVHDVSKGRNMEYAIVKKLADGRIYTGNEAMTLGLVDRLGNFEDAVEWAGELAGIEGEISVIYPPKPKLSIMEYVTESTMDELGKYFIDSKLSGGYIFNPGQ